VFLTYRYRLYPLRPQLQELDLWTHELAFLWNYGLEQRRTAWVRDHRSISYLDQQHDLPRWRAFDSMGLGRVPYEVAQTTLQRLDLAFRDFFRHVRSGTDPGYPRRRRSVDSFTFVPHTNPLTDGPNGTWRLNVPFLGAVPVRRHRPPPDAVVKFCILRREADGWFASLVYALPDPPPPPLEPPAAPVGIDLGLTSLAVLSDGTTISPPHFLKKAERRLGRAQRRLSRKERGSHRWMRQKERVARAHLKVARQRRWLAHQLSHDWTERFDLVAMEDLGVEMLGRGILSGPIHDAGWAMLRSMVEYKSQLRSHRFVAVDARGTSQMCSECGAGPKRRMELRERDYECTSGHQMDRDENAARNILARGMMTVGRKPTEVTRGEIGPLPRRVGRRTYQRRQARSSSRERAPGEPETKRYGTTPDIRSLQPER
jgi:putative transposase